MPARNFSLGAASSCLTTVILFWVRVPVLSEQMVCVLPRVSTAESLRIIAWRLAHLGHAKRKDDGHDGNKALGDGGDGERDGNHKGVEQGSRIGKDVAHAVAEDVNAKDDDADDDHHDGEDAAELGELHLQRRELFLGLGQGAGDLAQSRCSCRCRPRRRDQRPYTTGGAHIAHVLTVAERHVVRCRRRARSRWHASRRGTDSPCERGLFDLHRGALEHAAVGRDGVARLEHDHVAGHELGARQVHEFAVAQHLDCAALISCRASRASSLLAPGPRPAPS